MGVISRGRSLWFESLRTAALREENVAAPGPDQITVRALHSLVSAGSEMHLFRGEGNLPPSALPPDAGTLPFPVKFGYQVVGKVEAAGEQSGFAVGDLVFAIHPHQDRFTISVALAIKLSPDVDPLRALFLNMCTVAVQTNLEAPVRVGECVAVSGLGIIGSLIAHFTRKSAGRLILVDPNPARRAASSWIGADTVVDPAGAADAIKTLSDGRGVDMFIETSGAQAALQAAINNTGDRGSVVVPAWYGSRPVSLSLSPEFHLRALTLKSVFVMSMGGNEAARWTQARRVETALSVLKEIDPQNLTSCHVQFKNAPDAYRMIDEGKVGAPAVILDY
ncbi:MAG: hypothetical protein EPO08_05280 [Rhodospirillaceae bacterium]|nr:MAG: hypothetical protein EPO08_05280 [Rhodospirillaceae bacterium]